LVLTTDYICHRAAPAKAQTASVLGMTQTAMKSGGAIHDHFFYFVTVIILAVASYFDIKLITEFALSPFQLSCPSAGYVRKVL